MLNPLVLREFTKYTELVTVDKETPNEDDIDFFLERFLSRDYSFAYKNYYQSQILCHNSVDPITGEKPYDMSEKTYEEAYNELKPLLMEKVKEAYGSVSTDVNEFNWDPKPKVITDYDREFVSDSNMSLETWDKMSETEKSLHPIRSKAQQKANKVKSRINQYFEKTLPFMLRKTMHHPIAFVLHSKQSGYLAMTRLGGDRQYVKIDSEEELQEFLSKKTYDGESRFPGGKHNGIRTMLWTPTESGRNVKIGIVDIDNPANLPRADLYAVTRQVASVLETNGHPYIIMFTGNNFQVWFGPARGEELGEMRYVAERIRSYLSPFGEFNRKDAIENESFHFDESLVRPRRDGKSYQPTRMFFSLHYQIDERDPTKEYSGLAAVPVPVDDLAGSNQFEPAVHAHPEYVLDNFDMYAKLVSAFFDEVEIGQDYEGPNELETNPPCIRLEDRYTDSELISLIDNQNNSIPVKLEDIAKKVADEKEAYVYAKTRGVDAVLKYDEKGGIRFGGKALKTEKTLIDRVGNKKTRIEESTAALITRTGIVIHQDWITRDLANYCRANGISEITLVGQLVSYDYMLHELEESDILGMLSAKEIDSKDFKSLKFVVQKIASHQDDEVPFEAQQSAIAKISTNRLVTGPSRTFTEPMGAKLKKYYQNIRDRRRGSKLVVLGEEKYFISSTTTISMTIIGVDKTSKSYQQESKEIGPVYVALMKTTSSKGPVYHIIAKAEIALKKEDRIKLKDLVYGENNTNRVPLGVRDDMFTDVLESVEPTVVVDVSYEGVSNRMFDSLPFTYLPGSFEGAKKEEIFRIAAGKSYATKLENPKIVAIREDLNPRKEAHVTYKQDKLLEIRGTSPNTAFSIVKTLPNPIKTEDLYFGEDKPFGEEIDELVPWKMSEKAFKKLMRLSKKSKVIGYVHGKRMYYQETKGWTILGDNDAFFGASMTFKSIHDPFKLRGIDIINATKMSAEYGIKWHLIISEGKFYWMFCDIENSEIKREQKKYLNNEDYDGDVEGILSDLLNTVTSTYSPKAVVEDAKVPGFLFDVTVVEQVKNNPAFHGVPPYLGEGWADVYVDYTPIPKGEEGREVITPDGVFTLHQIGGRKVSPPLIDTRKTPATAKVPAEFANNTKPGIYGVKHEVFIDQNSLNQYDSIPHYTVTGLPTTYQVAKDDPVGFGADGNRIVKGDLERIDSYQEQLDLHNLSNRRQSKEDAKLLSQMFNYVPGGMGDPTKKDSETFPGTGISSDYVTELDSMDKKMKKSLDGRNFNQFDDSVKSVGLKNPPLKAESWGRFVDKYERSYAEWEKTPQPKQDWELSSVGLFPSHLVPMLEKERILRKARSDNELTEEELRIVNETFSEEMGANILESTLGDLFESDEDEDEEEVEYYEPENSDYDY